MPQLRYKNKTTGKFCFVIKREEKMLQVQYDPSGMTAWYSNEDFKRLFRIVT